ncbi:MAG TPA: tRNA pseudouridine(38-40) synthase TruA [Flavobacteriales bacterium]|nr:tRNA pseudouridine(38-40) synthase TruA [Flavobacteriales bacterium]
MRFFIELSYSGSNYHGWQIQPNANTVQAELNKALSTILNNAISVVGAGRTDSGVHARQMFAHFDVEIEVEIPLLITKLNGFLPIDIAILNIFKVNEDAHCRFDAISRTYKYYITNKKSPFNNNVYFHYKSLDVDAMNLACKHLLGKQDFTSFSKLHTQTHTNDCDLMLANWEKKDDNLIFSIKSDRFLRNMVRAIVGTLLEVGEGKITKDKVKKIIEKKDRSQSGVSVPAHALFLTNIEYFEKIM